MRRPQSRRLGSKKAGIFKRTPGRVVRPGLRVARNAKAKIDWQHTKAAESPGGNLFMLLEIKVFCDLFTHCPQPWE